MVIHYINRTNGIKEEEKIIGSKFLSWLYESNSGLSLLKVFIKKKAFSSIYGKLQDFSFSKNKIARFVKELDIDMSESEIDDIYKYKNFNDFFIRKLKSEVRPINQDTNVLVSPADGKILAYEDIDIDKIVQIKGMFYSLKNLLNDESLAREYDGGTCLVVRLAPSDYHRFHFADSGIVSETKKINGYFYSVNPISLKTIKNIYCQNKREFSIINSDNFDKFIMMEVGATCVGTIVQSYKPNTYVKKGDEKGYFKFGGSTVILFFKKDILKIDADILNNTLKGFETKIFMGEKIGTKI